MCRPFEARPRTRSPGRDPRPGQDLRPSRPSPRWCRPDHIRRPRTSRASPRSRRRAGRNPPPGRPPPSPVSTASITIRRQAPGGQVVEEEERTRPLDQDVVDAMVDQVRADRVVLARRGSHLELGPHPVGTGHQDRFPQPDGTANSPPKLPISLSTSGPKVASGQAFDAPLQAPGGLDIHAGRTIRPAHLSPSFPAGSCPGSPGRVRWGSRR